MAIKVKTPYSNSFHIPHICAGCGAPPGEGTMWKVSGSKSDWTGKRTTTLSVEVPLCRECHLVSINKGWAKFVSVMGVITIILTCILMAAMVGSGAFENTFLGVGIMIIVLAVLVIGMRILSEAINQKGFTSDQKERRKTVMKCARISSFSAPKLFDKTGQIIFQFNNEAFAQAFASVNLGQII